MNKNNQYYQIAKKLIFCISYQSFKVKWFSKSLTGDTNTTRVFSRTFRLTIPLDAQKECINCNVTFYKEIIDIYNKSIHFDL